MESEAAGVGNGTATVKRIAWRLAVGVAALALLAAAGALALAPDPRYRWRGWLSLGGYHAHDSLFTETGQALGVDRLLLKALAWEGSEFRSRHQGAFGEKGLIPLRPDEARLWAAAHGIENFMPTDLFDAQTSVRAAAWILARALNRWEPCETPETFALADLLIGRPAMEALPVSEPTVSALLAALDPQTKAILERVLQRRDFYRKHGW